MSRRYYFHVGGLLRSVWSLSPTATKTGGILCSSGDQRGLGVGGVAANKTERESSYYGNITNIAMGTGEAVHALSQIELLSSLRKKLMIICDALMN